jgi:sarcosine oxidase subunit beta
VNGKIILCRCEDVTLKDVRHAIDLGYADIEEVKRYTGFGTGPCQGKECLSLVAAVVAEHAGVEAVPPFTARPPLAPTPLRYFAGKDDASDV